MVAVPVPEPDAFELITEVVGLLRSAADVELTVASDDALADLANQLQHARSLLHAVESTVLAEVDDRGLARTWGWGSTADWYTHLAGVRVGQGRRLIEQAHQLISERGQTKSALVAGDVSPEQVQVILEAVDDLPGDEDLRNDAEAVLVERAGSLHATDLARVATSVLDVLDPDLGARRREAARDRVARAAHLRRFLTISDDGAGGVRIRGRGSAEDGAVLRSALLPLTSPVGSVDPDTGQRLADPRDYGVRLWDALTRVAQHALDVGMVPESHGCRPRVSVTTDLATLRSETAHLAPTEDGLRLSSSAVRRLACDAQVVPIVLGSQGEVLDVGRESRLVTPGIWRALVARDAGCSFPSCGRPPVMCHAHHVIHWSDGGATSLGNLAMLCSHHHRAIHDTPWQVRMGDDGRPEFLPPSALGDNSDPSPEAADWVRERRRLE